MNGSTAIEAAWGTIGNCGAKRQTAAMTATAAAAAIAIQPAERAARRFRLKLTPRHWRRVSALRNGRVGLRGVTAGADTGATSLYPLRATVSM